MSSGPVPGIPGFQTLEILDQARGAVLRARSLESGDEVAIRLLDRANEPVLPRWFDRRRKALLRLSRQNIGIVPLFGQGTAPDGRDFIVSPYYPEGSLQDRMDRGPVTWQEAAEVMAQLAEILGRVHAEQIVLGDLRPSKILIGGDGRPTIAAFGMATRRFDDGRPTFLAPEARNGHALTPAADVYALASIVGALVAGRARERDQTDEAFLTSLADLVPPELHDILDHGLAESLTNRYRSGSAMQRVLQRTLTGEPELSGGEPLTTLARLAPLGAAAGHTGALDIGTGDGAEELPPGLEDIVFAPPATTDTITLGDRPDDDPTLVSFDSEDQPDPNHPGGNGHRPAGEAVIDLSALDDDLLGLDDDLLGPDDDLYGPDDDVDLSQFVETREFTLDALDGDTGPADDDSGPADDDAEDEPTDEEGSGAGPDPNDAGPAGDARTPGAAATATLLREAESPPREEFEAGHDNPGPDDERVPDNGPVPQTDPVTDDDHSGSGQAPNDDPTEIFESAPIDDELLEPVGATPMAAPFTTAGLPPGTEDIPFRQVGRVHSSDQPEGRLAQLRVAAEIFWFSSRRTFSTLSAVLGLIAIVAVVVFFATRELRSASTSIRTDGVVTEADSPTTASASRATEVPFITDGPQTRRTTSTARSRAAATRRVTTVVDGDPAAPTLEAPPSTEDTTTIADITPPPPTEAPTTAPPDTRPPVTRPPVTRPPPGTRPAPTEPPITVEPAPTTAPPAPPTTAATTLAPTTAEPPPDPPVEPPSEPAKTAQVLDPPPTISKPKVVSLDADRASVSYSSDHCVATRFRLSGSDGSRQTGSSDGYDAAVHCSTAWNLDFVGASGLVPGVSYGLTVWVKSVAGQTARDSVSFTTPS